MLILVVDDEADVEVLFRQQFRRDLRADRFTMEFAQSAPMALQCIADVGDRSLILVLSDINMPGMTGLELLRKAKAMRPDVPIVMITAYGDAETKRKALESGAEALLTKPIDFGALRSEIDTRVERAAHLSFPRNLPDFAAVQNVATGPEGDQLDARRARQIVPEVATAPPSVAKLRLPNTASRWLPHRFRLAHDACSACSW